MIWGLILESLQLIEIYYKETMILKHITKTVCIFLLFCHTSEKKEIKIDNIAPIKIKGRIQIDEIKYSGSPKESWIVAGIRDTVTNDLAKIKEVEAISIDDQNKALQMITERRKAGEKNLDPSKETARILAADYVCVGNLQNTGKVLRLNIRLLKAPDFSAEQSATIDGTLDEIFTLQDKVVVTLLANVDAKMTPEERLAIEVFTPESKKAYELYSQGLEIQYTNPKKSLDLFLQALKLEPDYLDAMNRIGQLYQTFSQYKEALEYHQKRKKILEEKGLKQHSEYGITLNNIGVVYHAQSKYEEALDYFFKSNKIDEDLGLAKTAEYAATLNNIGVVYHAQGKYEKALDYYFKSNKIKEDTGLTKTQEYAATLNNIGLSYREEEKLDEALEFLFKSKKIMDELGLTNTGEYAIRLKNIGSVYYDKHEYCTSLEFFKKTYAIREKINIPQNKTNLEIAQKECDLSKPSNVVQEKKKAIDWIIKSNIWGTKDNDAVGILTEKIQIAIKEEKSIWIAFGSGILKSGLATEVHWKKNRFSIKELSDEEVKKMELAGMGIQSGGIND